MMRATCAVLLVVLPALWSLAEVHVDVPEARLHYEHLLYGQRSWLPARGLDADNLLGVDRYTLVSESRPELGVAVGQADLLLQPRWIWQRQNLHADRADASNWFSTTDWYFQTLRMRVQGDWGYFSGGRQALVWGPGLLFAPSNPFDPYTAKLHPKAEPSAADYWIIEGLVLDSWSVTGIFHSGRGQRSGAFSEAAALKADYLDGRWHGSLNVAKAESEDWHLGCFVSAHLTEALVGYSELGLQDQVPTLLIGGSYTTWQRWMISLEYLHSGPGERRLAVSEMLSDLLASAAGIEESTLRQGGASVDTLSDLRSVASLHWPLRKNYLLLQAFYPQWRRKIDSLCQYLYNLDDQSGRLLVYGESELGSHWRLFGLGAVYHGGRNAEFGGIIDYAATFGVTIHL